jgi:hypothetical protein
MCCIIKIAETFSTTQQGAMAIYSLHEDMP